MRPSPDPLWLAIALLVLSACAPAARRVGPGGPFPGGPGMADGAPTPVSTPAVPQIEGFSSAMRVGLTVYISGQVALDSTGAVVGAGDVSRQMQQAFENLFAVTRAARGLPADLVRVTVYVVDLQPEHTRVVHDLLASYFPRDGSPAVTVVGVSRLPRPDLLVAVDGIAVMRGEFPDRGRDRRYVEPSWR